MKQKIEIAANIAFVIGVVVLLSVLVKNRFSNSGDVTVDRGSILSQVPSYDWKAHDHTLLLALRNGCRYCEASTPFYRTLVGLEAEHKVNAHVLAIFPDDANIVQALLGAEKLSVDFRPNVSLGTLRISATPTLVLVNNEGRVERVWVGELPAAGREDVVNAVVTGFTSPLKVQNPTERR